MPKFQFRLSTVLRVREAARDQCRLRLAESQRADAELALQIVRLQETQRRLQAECRNQASPGEIDARRLVEAHQYAETLREEENTLLEQRTLLAAEIARRRNALIDADREVQVLEKLQQRRQQEHRCEEDRNQAKLLDEVAARAAG